jgi:hypothetical protein
MGGSMWAIGKGFALPNFFACSFSETESNPICDGSSS